MPDDDKQNQHPKVSRRSFLKGSVAAGVLLDVRHSWIGSQIHLKSGPGWVALYNGTTEIFRLQSNAFHGKANLWVERIKDNLAFGIEDARFAGTQICGDLFCELSRGSLGLYAKVRYEALGIEFQGDASEWLGGPGLWTHLPHRIRLIESEVAHVTVKGGPVRLASDGTLHFHGLTKAIAESAPLQLAAWCTELAAVRPDGLSADVFRTSKIVMHRSSADWDVKLPRGQWTYPDESTLFDRADFIAHEENPGSSRYVAELSRSSRRPAISVVLNEALTDSDGYSPKWRMQNPLYTVELGSSPRAKLTAELAEPLSLRLGNLRLNLRNPSNGAALIAEQSTEKKATSSITAEANLEGTVYEALILESKDKWNVSIGRDEKDPDDYATSTIKMAGGKISLEGALQFRVVRPLDALDLQFRITNVRLRPLTDEQPWLLRLEQSNDPSGLSVMFVDVGPQTLLEQAYACSSPTATDDCGNVPSSSGLQSKIASRSQVALQLFRDGAATALGLDTLLRWWQYPLQIVPQGETSPSAPPLQNSSPLEKATEIVAPAGLSFSPTETQCFFATETARVDNLGKDSSVAQIWNARLMTRTSLPEEGVGSDFSQFAVTDSTRPQIRAVWSRSILNDQNYGLSNYQTQEIVADMASLALVPNATTQHLCLSSAGAWLKTKAVWPLDSSSVSSFKVEIAGGEELLEEITIETVTIPSCHHVTVIVSTKRQWCRRPQAPQFLVARLIKRVKIKYHEKTKDYTYLRDGSLPEGALALPFDSITLIGDETPYLDEGLANSFVQSCQGHAPPQCGTQNQNGCGNDQPYWANVLGANGVSMGYPFPVQCVDRAGITHVTTMTMVLACAYDVYDLCYAQRHVGFYNAAREDAAPDFGKSRVAYAQPRKKGDTAHPTGRMTLQANLAPDLCTAQKNGTLPWYPVMVQAELSLDQLSAFGSGASNKPPTFMYAKQYMGDPFDQAKPRLLLPADTKDQISNPAELLLVVCDPVAGGQPTTGSPVALQFAGKLGGGLALPETGVQAVSRLQGTIFRTINAAASGIDDVETYLTKIGRGLFEVSDFFAGMGLAASLLGAQELSDLLDSVQNALAQAASLPLLAARQIQTLEMELVTDLRDGLSTVLALQSSLQTIIDGLRNQAQAILNQIQSLIQNLVSYIKVTLFEGAASDVTALINALEPGAGATGPVHALQELISQPVAVRIQNATSIPQSAAILPTLYQLRDYAAHQLIAAAESVASVQAARVRHATTPAAKTAARIAAAKASQQATTQAQDAIVEIENFLDGLLVEVTNKLNQQLANAGKMFASILECYVFQVADDLKALNDALVNPSEDELTDLASALEDVAQDVLGLGAALQQITDLFATFKTDLASLFNDTLATFKDAIGSASPATGFIGELVTALNPYPAVLSALENAAAGILTSSDIASWLDDFNSQVNDAIDFVNSVSDTLTNIQNQITTIQNEINDAVALLAIPRQIAVNYDYETPLNTSGPFVAEFKGAQSRFALHSSVVVNLNGTPPAFNVKAEVTNFQLLLLPSAPFVSIGFTSASFESVNGSAPKVSCPIDAKNVQLVGPLDFVSNLASAMGLPPELRTQITGLGAIIGVNLPLPNIESGAFVMMNLSLYAGVQLDFTGQPLQVSFGFASPTQHFTMTYAFLGGGGFADLTFTPSNALASMDVAAALEAGAMLALDFGVADGEVHAFAGFYMALTQDDCQLSGYYRCGGTFNVLGLISASIEFTMSLTYEDRGGTAWLSGECDVVVDVSVLFFSTSVELRMHHDFCGSSSD
jgi:hypothetical protein